MVYGDWAYPEYPPYYFAPPVGYLGGAVLATGIAFGAGFALGRWTSGGNYWGGGVNWGGGGINVARPVNINNVNIGSGNNWQHNAAHRHGVKYNNANVQQKFGGNNVRPAGAEGRGEGRGDRPSAGTADRTPGGRQDAGGRTDAGNRPSAGTKDAKSGAKGSAAKGSAAKGAAARRPAARVQARQRDECPVRQAASAQARAAGKPRRRRWRRRSSRQCRRRRNGWRRGFSGGGRGGGGGGFSAEAAVVVVVVGGGGRRSDITVKHDIALLGRLDNGLGFYRYSYNGSSTAYVGVIAQEVQAVMPEAVVRGRDGYLRVFYDRLGLKFETYKHWVAAGARIPSVAGSMSTQLQNW